MALARRLAFSVQWEESSSPFDLGDFYSLVPELHPMSLLRSGLAYRPFTPLTSPACAVRGDGVLGVFV